MVLDTQPLALRLADRRLGYGCGLSFDYALAALSTVPVPVADSTGAITGFGVVVIIFLVFAGIAGLRVRNGRKTKREYAEVQAAGLYEHEESGVEIQPNAGAMALATIAAALAVVSVFLPALETSAFSSIAKNTLIQGGGGWLVLGCAVGILGAVYRAYSTSTTTWAVFVLGLVILGVAIYSGTGDRTKLESIANPFLHKSVTVNGSPAVGIYAAGAAGILAMFAGFILAGNSVSSYQGVERRTKACPDCAETVLEAARVCKHCGHRFDIAATPQ
ncbi:MAG: zinc ribbon domain-containing protein [Solirubrobacterales bacterium]